MSVFMGPLRWYGFKTFATREQANMHQALLAMQGVYTVISVLRTSFILVPASESEIKELLVQIDTVGNK